MSLLSATTKIEASDSFHLARLLILIDCFAGKDRKDAIEGITKLAKLDFFLRYPPYLERALRARQTNPSAAAIQEFERNSVESMMIRFKYGPWDFRYRRFLNLLIAKGFVHVMLQGRTVHVGITERGRALAQQLGSKSEFDSIRSRARLLKTHLDLSATTLMNFVYSNFPEIVDLRFGDPIK